MTPEDEGLARRPYSAEAWGVGGRTLAWVDQDGRAVDGVTETEILALARSLVDPRPCLSWEEVQERLERVLEPGPRTRIREALDLLQADPASWCMCEVAALPDAAHVAGCQHARLVSILDGSLEWDRANGALDQLLATRDPQEPEGGQAYREIHQGLVEALAVARGEGEE